MRCLIFVIILSFGVSASASKMAPTKRVYETIEFSDDLNFDNMIKAIDRQLVQLSKLANLKTKFKLGTLTYNRQNLKDSLIVFKQLVVEAQACLQSVETANCYADLSSKVNKDFAIYKPLPEKTEAGYSTGRTLFT